VLSRQITLIKRRGVIGAAAARADDFPRSVWVTGLSIRLASDRLVAVWPLPAVLWPAVMARLRAALVVAMPVAMFV
jgi:hypothetical protein